MSDKLTIEYIKANGIYYYHQNNKHVRIALLNNVRVGKVKKLSFGRWRIDYTSKTTFHTTPESCDLQEPSKPDIPAKRRVILYPSGIEEIRYID